jgi:predicted nucleotidyltransferase component of viral defense system
MLNANCFSRAWIQQQANLLHCQDYMLEKAILALQLLANLVETGLPFQFKGGTSLLLRLPQIHRLSIDIDIATQATENEVQDAVTRIGQISPFFHAVHDQDRDAALPPKKHFRFLFPSAINNNRSTILLDVLYEPNPTPYCEPVLIKTPFIDCTRELRVNIPSVESLLGDKLTAFAPTTIGIPYFDRRNENRQTDIIKQLFDAAALFDAATNLQVVTEVYTTVHANQCCYRERAFTEAQTLDDSIEAAMQLSAHKLPGFTTTPTSQQLGAGVGSLANHLVNQPFGPDDARIAAGKVACLAAWLKSRPVDKPIDSLRYSTTRINELRDKQIGQPWPVLDRLKTLNIEAFHYWWLAHQLNFPKNIV